MIRVRMETRPKHPMARRELVGWIHSKPLGLKFLRGSRKNWSRGWGIVWVTLKWRVRTRSVKSLRPVRVKTFRTGHWEPFWPHSLAAWLDAPACWALRPESFPLSWRDLRPKSFSLSMPWWTLWLQSSTLPQWASRPKSFSLSRRALPCWALRLESFTLPWRALRAQLLLFRGHLPGWALRFKAFFTLA